jgi:predicted dehydrogenase
MVEAGEIGTPITATMIWAMRKPDDYFKQNWRTKFGSPVMISLVCDIDLLRFVLDEMADLSAVGAAPIRSTQRIESGAVALLFASGATAAISFADTTPSPWGFEAGTDENPHIASSDQDTLWIIGTHGGMAFPSITKWSGAEDWSQMPQSEHLKIPKATPSQRPLGHFIEVMQHKVPPLTSVFEAQKTLHTTLTVKSLLNKKRGRQIINCGNHQTNRLVQACSQKVIKMTTANVLMNFQPRDCDFSPWATLSYNRLFPHESCGFGFYFGGSAWR